jgi:hypothetical protein
MTEELLKLKVAEIVGDMADEAEELVRDSMRREF